MINCLFHKAFIRSVQNALRCAAITLPITVLLPQILPICISKLLFVLKQGQWKNLENLWWLHIIIVLFLPTTLYRLIEENITKWVATFYLSFFILLYRIEYNTCCAFKVEQYSCSVRYNYIDSSWAVKDFSLHRTIYRIAKAYV